MQIAFQYSWAGVGASMFLCYMDIQLLCWWTIFFNIHSPKAYIITNKNKYDTTPQWVVHQQFNGIYLVPSQSELIGDFAVPVSVSQVVLFCALRSLTRVRDWIGADLPPPSLARYVLDDLDATSSSLERACRAREWSWDLSAWATWPNNFRRLVRTVSDSSGCPSDHWIYWEIKKIIVSIFKLTHSNYLQLLYSALVTFCF